MKRVFASDLDQTLIYSHKFLDQLCDESKEELEVIEILEGREISYITKFTKRKLNELIRENKFIPVTTRTMAQYNRINFESKPLYAVTSNGGNILYCGEILEEWSHFINEEMTNLSLSINQVINEVEKYSEEEWLKEWKVADNLFLYLIIDRERIPLQVINKFSKWLYSNGWNFSIQGRKVYMIPNCIDKWRALDYIGQREKIKSFVTAGDSKLDLSLVNKAKYSIVPKHGKELLDNAQNEKINVTKLDGIFASNEIIEFSIEKINEIGEKL